MPMTKLSMNFHDKLRRTFQYKHLIRNFLRVWPPIYHAICCNITNVRKNQSLMPLFEWRVVVPSRGDVVGVGRPGPDLPRQPEVPNFDDVRARAEKVFRLHVPVEVAVFVHETEALQHLPHHVADHGFREQLVTAMKNVLGSFASKR